MDLLKNMAQQREETVADLHLDLPIPTWKGGLVVRLDVLGRKAVEKFGQKQRTVEGDLDFLIKATRELYALDPEKTVEDAPRMEENEDYVQIADDNGIPVKWDNRLAEKIGMPGDTSSAREVLMYCVKDNALGIGGLAGKAITWMQDTDAEVTVSLAGE